MALLQYVMVTPMRTHNAVNDAAYPHAQSCDSGHYRSAGKLCSDSANFRLNANELDSA